MQCHIIGIGGPTCGGKTTASKMIVDKFKNVGVTMYSIDRRYKGGGPETNYDVPEALDIKGSISDLTNLKNGIPIDAPIYNFKTHRPEGTEKIYPNPIIIVEGILIFCIPELREIFDFKVYVDCYPELRFYRRMTRDTKERGRDEQEVCNRYFRDVVPSNTSYVEPSKNYCDVILQNNNMHEFIGIDLILSHIKITLKKINKNLKKLED